MTDHLPAKSLYAVLLFAYPRDFRARFGSEMIETFSEEILIKRKQHGSRGALHAWCSALWELFSVAAPLHLQNSMVAGLFLSLLASSALCLAFFAAVSPHCAK